MTMNVEVLRGPDTVATATYARLFHALSDESRLAILQHLSLGEHRVRDLVEHMGFAQSTISKHLSCLRECGLVTVRTEGRASWFALAEPELLAELLRGAEGLLEATGSQVMLCRQLLRHRPGGRAR
ncbi:metalloregulator ArsR/SmtB family transcription factor [Brooklawnia cerclae]|uniref:DNA-binding transcriptional ArsR family regulator n=1 Tax=Brooklawnia cerclae TaxID=349934 RepID=A0ABX0SBE9_9ACTN|nr:metalloregulator ArsR/SmtB family transcription factor [Brooklawnia cerclae]NIH55714.1 DNA-binding transcriptional ArsR family regulator [Brooklawnia cerclae]